MEIHLLLLFLLTSVHRTKSNLSNPRFVRQSGYGDLPTYGQPYVPPSYPGQQQQPFYGPAPSTPPVYPPIRPPAPPTGAPVKPTVNSNVNIDEILKSLDVIQMTVNEYVNLLRAYQGQQSPAPGPEGKPPATPPGETTSKPDAGTPQGPTERPQGPSQGSTMTTGVPMLPSPEDIAGNKVQSFSFQGNPEEQNEKVLPILIQV